MQGKTKYICFNIMPSKLLFVQTLIDSDPDYNSNNRLSFDSSRGHQG